MLQSLSLHSDDANACARTLLDVDPFSAYFGSRGSPPLQSWVDSSTVAWSYGPLLHSCMGKAKRQHRQSSRPGQQNREFSRHHEAGASFQGTSQTAESEAPEKSSPTSHVLTPREKTLFGYVTWSTSRPPPMTIFVRPYLQALTRSSSQRAGTCTDAADEEIADPADPAVSVPLPSTPPNDFHKGERQGRGRRSRRLSSRSPSLERGSTAVRSPQMHGSSTAIDPRGRSPLPRRRGGAAGFQPVVPSRDVGISKDGEPFLLPKPKRYPLRKPASPDEEAAPPVTVKDAEEKLQDKTKPPIRTKQLTQTRTKQVKQAQQTQKQTQQTQQTASSPTQAGGPTATTRLRKFRTPKSALKYTAAKRKPLGPSPPRGAAPRSPSDNEVSLVDPSTSVESPETRRPPRKAQPAARDPRVGKRLRTTASPASSPASLVSMTDAPPLVAEPGDLIESLLKAPMAAGSDTLPFTPSDGAGSPETSKTAAVLSSTSTSVRKSAALPKDYLYSEDGPLATAKRPRCKGIWFISEPAESQDDPETSKGAVSSASSRAYKELLRQSFLCELWRFPLACQVYGSVMVSSSELQGRKMVFSRHESSCVAIFSDPGTLLQASSASCRLRSNSHLRSDALTTGHGRPTSCHRLKLVTLNVGGLSQMAYAELLQHLQSLPQQAKPDVLLLQETHWREHSEYSTAGWHIIGSANVSPQAGGVAIFVADHLCTAEHILHTSPIPGRILHARLALSGATVDIVNVYQKIAASSLQSTEKGHQPGTTNRGLRREVWTTLRKLIRGLPSRHVVVVAGDFNTPVKSVNSRVGARADILSSTPPADQGELLDLIHDCDLLHLNSWTRFAKHTFRNGDHASLIDHIFVRHSLGDTISRRAGPISWQLFPWRSGGRHSPVCASIQVPHISALFKRSGPKLRVLDKVTLAQACRNDADPRIWALRDRVSAWLHAHQDATVEAVNAELHSTALDLFPGKLQHGRIVPWQSEQVGMAVRTMWAAYRTWRSTAKACSKHIWRAWAAYSKFCKAHRAFRRSTRQAKTAWFKNQVEVMEASARKGDTRALFQLAARFGPKQKRRKLQLRSEDGGILSHAEQADVLHQFYKNLYCTEAPDTHAQILDSLMNSTLPACPFACLSLDTIPQALQHLSPHKAAPSHLAHTSVWIACSDVVSPWLTRFLQTTQQIPQLWKDTWLSLLPKVATPTLPRQLRPLGISEISGRVVCGLIQDQLRSYVETFLSTEPQFAYMANRSTDQALLRVLLHCTEGRRICEPQVYDLRQARFSCSQSRSESASKKARGGAIQLSLDLTQAFDRLEWGLISDALIAASVPVELYSLIILWHRSLYYHLKAVDATAAVPVQRGVRQGCRIAPMLWAISTVLIMRRADAIIGSSWSRDHLTAYADDFHAGEIIHRSEDLSKALWRFGAFLDCLTSAHLVVNSQKSAILLRLCKGLAPAWRRSHIKKGPDGPFLSFCSPGGTRYNIPLKQEHVYLGLVISYHSSETASVSHRTRAAWATWTRLRPALTSASAPARDLRLRLWRACVPPTLLYGLHVIRLCLGYVLALAGLCTLVLNQLKLSNTAINCSLLCSGCLIRVFFMCNLSLVLLGTLRLRLPRPLSLMKLEHCGAVATGSCFADAPDLDPLHNLQIPHGKSWLGLSSVLPSLLVRMFYSVPSPQGHPLQGPLSPSAVEQEKAMFQHLLSDYPLKPSRSPSAKRPRPGHEKEDSGDAPMPAAGSIEDPFRQGPPALRGRTPRGWSKGGKGKGKSKGQNKGYGKGYGKHSYGTSSLEGGPWSKEADHYSMDRESLMEQMARMMLRHERQLQSLQQDQKLHLFLRPEAPASAVPLMVKVAQTWRKLMDEGKVRSSLREAMLRELIQELRNRIQGFNARSEMKEKAMQMNWTDSQGAWNYLRWNPETQQEELVPQVESRTTESILADLKVIEDLISGTTIRHFGSVRPFRQHYETSWVQFTLEIELRTDGDLLWKHFNALINSSVLHLLAARLRRDRATGMLGVLRLAIAQSLIQDCIDQWHSQHTSASLAFTPETSLIALQLMRFNAEGRGKWRRTVKSLHTNSHLLDDVVVPTFVDLESMQCLYPRYKVASIVAHFGDRADSGHYRCLWNENNTALIADDAAVIATCTLSLLEEISANAYLVFLTRECD
ncbi:hypothetical protein AK812_SmicGene41706 [Symbiodinium microadriaticum]|uniref:Reverse transcriptase domain-containing protein n=1 Tax=Symbiodinium microadriaticum TaxID=2951 RepID=A0A1Q9C5F3_SYMMI|nr:hypothetical protein AK812_SmicGene41706 [Symbiodinium microadriaticum]